MPPKGYQSLGEALVTCATRLPASLMHAVDDHLQFLRSQAPWARVNRADALRDLVTRGLAITAQERAVGAPPPEARLRAQYQMSEDTRTTDEETAPSAGAARGERRPTPPDPVAQLSYAQEAEEAGDVPAAAHDEVERGPGVTDDAYAAERHARRRAQTRQAMPASRTRKRGSKTSI
jgi:hypothetical protein